MAAPIINAKMCVLGEQNAGKSSIAVRWGKKAALFDAVLMWLCFFELFVVF
jgi:hypothetical protein